MLLPPFVMHYPIDYSISSEWDDVDEYWVHVLVVVVVDVDVVVDDDE
jgi:hypothetical protein